MGPVAANARDGGASMAWMISRRQTLASLALLGATGGRAARSGRPGPRSVARPQAHVFQRRVDRGGQEPRKVRGARARRGRGARAGVVLGETAAGRQAPHGQADVGHRPESCAAGRRLHPRREGGRYAHLDPGPGQFLHQRPRRGRTQRRLAAHGDPLHQGLGRLLGADGEDHGRSAGRRSAR